MLDYARVISWPNGETIFDRGYDRVGIESRGGRGDEVLLANF